jgi:hypothetical protein
MSEILTAVQKAFALNLDPDLYGSIAEIGAGQEVARYFFKEVYWVPLANFLMVR